GFSFQADEPLDMRLDPSQADTAASVLNTWPEDALADAIYKYGDERYARRIARAVVRRRPLATTGDLVAAVRSAVPRPAWPRRRHAAPRTFYAVRPGVTGGPGAL